MRRARHAAAAALLLLALRTCTAGSMVGAGPGVPENITVTFLNPSTVRVSWATAAESVDKYDVTYKPTDASYRVVAVVAGNSDAVTLSGLLADTQYQLTVAAVLAGHKYRSRPIVFRTLEPPRTSPQQDAGALPGGATPRAPATPDDPLPTFPTIRGVEVGIVVLVLIGWVGAIALFFNRWGKIRMLLPYQPDYKQEQLKVPGTGVCAAAAGSSCGGNHGAGPACSHLHWSHAHTQSLECEERLLARATRPRVNSAVFMSAEPSGFGAFDAGDFLRRYGSQSKLCRKARSADNIPLTTMEEGSTEKLCTLRMPREEPISEEPSKDETHDRETSNSKNHFGLPILSVSGPSPRTKTMTR